MVFLVVLLCGLWWGVSQAQAQIDTGLRAWWKLDETTGTTAADSGDATPLTWQGTTSWLPSGSCVPGFAASNGCAGFNGSSYLRANTSRLSQDGTVTIAMQLYITGGSGERWGFVEGDDSQNRFFAVGIDGVNALLFEMQADGPYVQFSGTAPLSTNTWHCVVAVINSAGPTITLYLNSAVHVTHNSWNGTVFPFTANRVTVGANEQDLQAWQGRIDEVRLVDHPWTGTDVTNYCAYTGPPPPPGGRPTPRILVLE